MWPFSKKHSEPALGRRGEGIARRHLKRMGFKILATNYRCSAGEADLIALDSSTIRSADGVETLVFVEVKTRSCDKYTDPQAAVDADKQARLRKIAKYYLTTHNAADMNVRFDVVAVVAQPGQALRITHIPDAF